MTSPIREILKESIVNSRVSRSWREEDGDPVLNEAEEKIKALIESQKELHKHDSFPCYVGEEKEGCIICIKNKVISDIIKRLFRSSKSARSARLFC